jgi:hypothetical protein
MIWHFNKAKKVLELVERGSKLQSSITEQIAAIRGDIQLIFISLCEQLGLTYMQERLLEFFNYLLTKTNKTTTMDMIKILFKIDNQVFEDLSVALHAYWTLHQPYDIAHRKLSREEASIIFKNIPELPDWMSICPFSQKVIRIYSNDHFLFELHMGIMKEDNYTLKYNQYVLHMDKEQITELAKILIPILDEAYEHLKGVKEHNDEIVKFIKRIVRPYRLARDLAD